MSQATISYPTTEQPEISQNFWFSDFKIKFYTKMKDFFDERIEKLRDNKPLSSKIIAKAKAAKNAPASDFVDL